MASQLHQHNAQNLPSNVSAFSSTDSIALATPDSETTNAVSTPRSGKCTSSRSSNCRLPIQQAFKPYLGNPFDPLEICVDSFLTSPTFELICIQAVQLAAILPCSPPPKRFISFDTTPMHHWYQALLMEFVDIFMRLLRMRNTFPLRYAVGPLERGGLIYCEDAETFNAEATAHINAILTSFDHDFAQRPCGSTHGLSIDPSQPNRITASIALQEAVSLAGWPPKKDWKVGERLHAEYKRRLRMFETGVMRLVAERGEARWMLGLPGVLDRGVNAYKEHYIANLRKEILRVKKGSGTGWAAGRGIVGDLDTGDVFL